MALEPPPSRDADDLIRRHLTLVRVAVARIGTRVPPHVDRDDLVAAGHLGLVQAARAFDPSRGVPFDRYAQLRITGAIQDELRSLDTATRRGRAAMRRLDQATEVLSMELGRLPSTSEVARWLGEDTGGCAGPGPRAPTSPPCAGPDRSTTATSACRRRPDRIPRPPCSAAELRQDLADAIAALPPRLALVVVAHVLDGREVKSIAADFGVTPSRVSQLCGEALLLLRSALDDAGVDTPAGAAPARQHHLASAPRHLPRRRTGLPPPAPAARARPLDARRHRLLQHAPPCRMRPSRVSTTSVQRVPLWNRNG